MPDGRTQRRIRGTKRLRPLRPADVGIADRELPADAVDEQIPVHFLSGGVTVLRTESAGLQHDAAERGIGIARRGERFALHAPDDCVLAVDGTDRLRRGRQKRQSAVVQQAIHDETQRIDIAGRAVPLALIDLGGHIVIGALLAHERHGGFERTRDAEIAELIIAVRGNEDVVGLDVPVDDAVLCAEHERAAEIQAELDDLLDRQRLLGGAVGQAFQKLHADEDVVADAARLRKHARILEGNDVRVPLQAIHQRDLLRHVLRETAVIGRDRSIVHAVRAKLLDLALFGRDRDVLQRGIETVVQLVAVDLVHAAEAARADELLGVPFAEQRLKLFDSVHNFPLIETDNFCFFILSQPSPTGKRFCARAKGRYIDQLLL